MLQSVSKDYANWVLPGTECSTVQQMTSLIQTLYRRAAFQPQ